MDPRNGGDLLCSQEGVYSVLRRRRREGGAGYGCCPIEVGGGDPQDPPGVPAGRDDEEEQGGARALLPEDLPPVVGTPGSGEGPPGQGQERYSKATGLSPARRHRGPWQTSPGAMEATGDRGAGTQSKRGSPARQSGPATQITRVRWSYRRQAGAIPLVVRDTPHGWAAPRAASQRRGHVALPMDTCGDTLPPGTHGPGGRDNVFRSVCGSGSRGT